MSATTEIPFGSARIDELAAGKLFGDYMRTFPESSRDAGEMLRLAVEIEQVERYQRLLALALRERRPVRKEEWHALCASASWPRPMPEWNRQRPKPVVIGARMTREMRKAMAWSSEHLPGFISSGPESDPAQPRRSIGAVALRVLAIGICATMLDLALPESSTTDYWIGMATFIVALVVASTF